MSVVALILAFAVASTVGAQAKGNGKGNSQNTHGAAVSAIAKSTCTAVNHHPTLPANAAAAAKTATSKPNHGQCVSAAAHQNTGHGKSKNNHHVLTAGTRLWLLKTFTTACNTNATALKTAIATGGKTLLAICQGTNASVTQSSLVSTLLAALKTKLDRAVTAKALTTTQESTRLTQAQARLTTLVTTSIPAGGLHLHK
jgi:hypothetical protein